MESYSLNVGRETLLARPAALDCVTRESPEDHWFAADEHPAVAAGHAHRLNKLHGKRHGKRV